MWNFNRILKTVYAAVERTYEQTDGNVKIRQNLEVENFHGTNTYPIVIATNKKSDGVRSREHGGYSTKLLHPLHVLPSTTYRTALSDLDHPHWELKIFLKGNFSMIVLQNAWILDFEIPTSTRLTHVHISLNSGDRFSSTWLDLCDSSTSAVFQKVSYGHSQQFHLLQIYL